MEEIISRVAAAAGIDNDTAKNAVAEILAFVKKEAPEGPVGEMLAKIPGGEALAASVAGEGGGGGLMGALGGLMGGGGGLMALAGKLMGLGLGMGEMQSVGKEVFAYAREKAGEDVVGQIAGSIPGLSQFI
jgi:hypothetical protein